MDPTLAGAYTGFAPATLAKFRCQGGGPRFSRVGRSIRYNVDALDKWLESQSFDSTSQYGRNVTVLV